MKRTIFPVLVCSCLAASAGADMSVGFVPIATSDAIACAVADQFAVEISSVAANQVLFYFTNAGSIASNIAEIYFDDGTLLGIAELRQDPAATSFYQWTPDVEPAPRDLPSGETLDPDFDVTTYFAVDSSGGNSKGINPGEYLGVVFTLKDGGTLQDVLDELASGELRIGLHVRSVDNAESYSFVNTPYVVPVPGAVLLGMLGLSAAGLRLRKKA